MHQVEQFIETIFPSQNPQSVVQKPPETEAEKKEREEAKWDISKSSIYALNERDTSNIHQYTC